MPGTETFQEQFGLEEPEDTSVTWEDATTVDPPSDYEEPTDDGIDTDTDTDNTDTDTDTDTDSNTDSDTDTDNEADKSSNDTGEEYEDYPDFLPEDLIPLEQFDSPEAELEFYRDNYDRVIDTIEGYYNSEEYAERILDAYEEQIVTANENAEELLAIRDMLHNDPLLAIKTYFPEGVAQLGGSPQITESEAVKIVDGQLKEAFGANYREKFDETEATISDSLSNKMIVMQQKALEEIEKHNNEVKDVKIPGPPSEEEIEEKLDNMYKETFEPLGVTEEEYVEFLDQAAEKQIGPEDYYKLVYMDDIIEEAYNMGKEENQKSLGKRIESIGGKDLPHEEENANRNNGVSSPSMKDYLFDIYRH